MESPLEGIQKTRWQLRLVEAIHMLFLLCVPGKHQEVFPQRSVPVPHLIRSQGLLLALAVAKGKLSRVLQVFMSKRRCNLLTFSA